MGQYKTKRSKVKYTPSFKSLLGSHELLVMSGQGSCLKADPWSAEGRLSLANTATCQSNPLLLVNPSAAENPAVSLL